MPNLKTGRMEPLISALTEEEEEQFGNCIRRLNTLLQVLPRASCRAVSRVRVQAARELYVWCMVDAEQTYFQPAIARITIEMMTKYNTEKAIIFNTYQVTYIVLHTTYMVVIILSRVNIDIGTMLCCGVT